MNLTVSELSKLLKIASPATTKAAIKLITIDVLKSLSDSLYLIESNGKEFRAQSDIPLDTKHKYWALLELSKESAPKLTKLLKQPPLLNELRYLPSFLDTKELQRLFSHSKPLEQLKLTLLEHLSHAASKEEFTNISNLLASLLQNTLTFPLHHHEYLGFFQMKKRYNKNIKKSVIDFYAALPHLGPLSGRIYMNETIHVELEVLFKMTQLYLQEQLNDFPYKITITTKESIEPLYLLKNDSLLDMSV